jgi:hypothetical protein
VIDPQLLKDAAPNKRQRRDVARREAKRVIVRAQKPPQRSHAALVGVLE